MSIYAKDTIQVQEGLSIRKNGTKYHYLFRIDGNLIRKTTGTGDKRKAKEIAVQAYQKAVYEQENGLAVVKISFKNLSQKYVQHLEGQNKQSFHKDTIKRHLQPFFGKFPDINKIKTHHLDEYLLWRKSNKPDLTAGTLNKEHAVFNQMMRFAKKREWLSEELKFERLKEEANPRPYFSEEQLKILMSVGKKRIAEFKASNLKGQAKGLNRNKLWNRELVYDLAIFVLDCGVRPCELKTIKWKHVNYNRKCVKLFHAGKTKSNREFFIRTDKGIKALERIYQRRLDYIHQHGGSFSEEEYIQALPTGKKVACIKKSVRALIHACDFSSDEKLKHTFYSLRHTYATQALAGTGGKSVPIRALSMQMGTSIRMIEQHYGHDNPSDYIDLLVN